MHALLWSVLLAAPVLASAPKERGMALGLFSMDPSFDYQPLIQEIKALGATHLSICWVWWQDDQSANEIKPVERWSATDGQVRSAIHQARALGLTVTAFPILRLIHPGRSAWRGTIAPTDEELWWSSYQRFILGAAALAREEGASRLSIGSELLSREAMRSRWAALIDRVRLSAPELSLLYSANWDHFTPVAFWDLVDQVGVSAYFEVGRAGSQEQDLVQAWRPIQASLSRFSRELGRPIVITEIGYPSLRGGSVHPWDQTPKAPIDLDEQARAYRAFIRAWSGSPFLEGVYFWNWFGPGGAEDGDYTPRGKPAARLIEAWYQR